MVVKAAEDAHVQKRYPKLNRRASTVLLVNGGESTLGDIGHCVTYLKFRFQTPPGKVLSVRLRIRNGNEMSYDAGRICLVSEPWQENKIAYANRPPCGAELARMEMVSEGQVVERPLKVDLQGKTELSLAIDPIYCVPAEFLSRESGSPPELVIDYDY